MDQEKSLNNSLSRLLERAFLKGRRQLYFSTILRESNLPSELVEGTLFSFFQSGAVEGSLELRCPECGKDLGEYKKLSEMPQEVECYICDAKIPRSFDYVELVVHLKGDTFFREHRNPPSDDFGANNR